MDPEVVELFATYGELIKTGWGRETHRKFFADVFLGSSAPPEAVAYFEEMQRRSASPETALAYFRSVPAEGNGFSLAKDVRVPTLVIHPREDQIVSFEFGRALAAEIPGARFMPTEGDVHWLLLWDGSTAAKEYITAIEDFLASDGP